jgi:hypothetical protein
MAEGRKRFSNQLFLANVEKAAQRFEAWSEARTPGAIAVMRQMQQMMRAQLTSAARA